MSRGATLEGGCMIRVLHRCWENASDEVVLVLFCEAVMVMRGWC